MPSAGFDWPQAVWLAQWLIQSVIRFPHHKRNKNNIITKQNLFTMDRLTLFMMFLWCVPMPLLFVITLAFREDFFFGDYFVPEWAQIVGAVLCGPGLILFYLSHKHLGRNWSAKLEVHEEHSLVTNGIYKYMRHPMYTAIWFLCIAQTLTIPNYLCGFPVVVAYLLMNVTRIPQEEALMREEFGEEYDKYCATTKRLIPYVL